MKTSRKASSILGSGLLGLLLATSAGVATAETAHASFGAHARVLVANQAALSATLPLPLPGHLLQDDARGRHYVFEGAIDSARAFYRLRMDALGYELVAEDVADATAVDMHFRRGNDEMTLVTLRAAIGSAPTRVGLRAMRR